MPRGSASETDAVVGHPPTALLAEARRVALLLQDQVLARRVARTLQAAGNQVLAAGAWPDASGPDTGVDVAVVEAGKAVASRVAAAQEARRHFPEAAIIVLVTGRVGDVRKALDAGARAIIPADAVERCLRSALAAVRAGLVVVPVDPRPTVSASALSFREKEVLRQVVLGRTNAEIAADLFLAESTVKSHLKSVFGKLGVSSRSEAAETALTFQASPHRLPEPTSHAHGRTAGVAP